MWTRLRDCLGRMWRRISVWGPYLEINFTYCSWLTIFKYTSRDLILVRIYYLLWALVWWLSRRDRNPQCNPCTMEATVGSISLASQPLLLSLYVRSNRLYTFFSWCTCQIVYIGTCASLLTWMLLISFTCILFKWMLEVIVTAISRYVMCIYSGCFNIVMGVWQACV